MPGACLQTKQQEASAAATKKGTQLNVSCSYNCSSLLLLPAMPDSCLQIRQQEASASATKKGVQLKAASKQLDKLKKDITKSGERAALLLLLLTAAASSSLCGCPCLAPQPQFTDSHRIVHQSIRATTFAAVADLPAWSTTVEHQMLAGEISASRALLSHCDSNCCPSVCSCCCK
jgi:hypothetical protein